MNILPIPALDGGHVVFLLYEIITGKEAPQKILEYAQYEPLFGPPYTFWSQLVAVQPTGGHAPSKPSLKRSFVPLPESETVSLPASPLCAKVKTQEYGDAQASTDILRSRRSVSTL